MANITRCKCVGQVTIRQQGRVRKAFRIPRLVAWPRIPLLCCFQVFNCVPDPKKKKKTLIDHAVHILYGKQITLSKLLSPKPRKELSKQKWVYQSSTTVKIRLHILDYLFTLLVDVTRSIGFIVFLC